MVLYVMKWVIRAEKVEAYQEWTQGAIQRTLGVPGVVEFRAYRPPTGASQVVVTYEFADLADWAAWYSSEAVQNIQVELRSFVTDLTNELWGPSPIVPGPVRPGG